MLKRIRALLGGARQSPGDPEAPNPPVPSPPTAPISAGAPVHRGPSVVHRPIPRSDLDPDALRIVERLTRFDHSAYLVGGCVRDLLLDRKPKDFDLGTSATPRQVKRLFRNSRIIGRRFRLAHVYFQNGKIIEVATFRALDGDDGSDAQEAGEVDERDLMIRDDNVFGTAEEDALRRDFTINALFYDVNNETVLDHAEGLHDLRARLVRTIGDPEIRFREDPIRSLRAIKFAARLGFEIEPATLAALRKTRHEIAKAAPPRILEEINRFCRGGAARRSFELLRETGTLPVVLPEIAPDYERDAWAWDLACHLLEQMDRRRFPQPREIRTGEILAVLLLPIVTQPFGWTPEGIASPPRGVRAQDVVDERLRPIALRLRISKREQEHCRQILATLHRMVPARNLRTQTRRVLSHRECFPDTLELLESLALRLGADFAEAAESWRAEGAGAAATQAGAREADAEPRSGEGRGRTRRGRRRSGRTRETTPQAAGRATAGSAQARARPAKRADLPPPWDDGYFFAALPSVPDGEAVELRETSSNGAPSGFLQGSYPAAASEVDSASGEVAEEAPAADGTRPRRRRRRRRRKPREPVGSGGNPAGEMAGDGGGPADGGE